MHRLDSIKHTDLVGALAAGVLLLVTAQVSPAQSDVSKYSNKLAPYVPSPPHVVERMLEMANLKPGETIYDLGCGDGRILITAAQLFRAKGVGVEISDRLAKIASNRVQKLGLQNQVKIIHGDLMNVDLSGADVVTIYLLTLSNEELRPRLEKYLKPGARVVSHDFAVPGWKPTEVDRSSEHPGHSIYLYVMPAGKK
ncbi:MAG TPA: class I SAM-dependent methyltransferase [Bryobacteraceae bacterium]|nr:class I SAM-dependent methyltransferase [Bryobacteraceae bacterium]